MKKFNFYLITATLILLFIILILNSFTDSTFTLFANIFVFVANIVLVVLIYSKARKTEFKTFEKNLDKDKETFSYIAYASYVFMVLNIVIILLRNGFKNLLPVILLLIEIFVVDMFKRNTLFILNTRYHHFKVLISDACELCGAKFKKYRVNLFNRGIITDKEGNEKPDAVYDCRECADCYYRFENKLNEDLTKADNKNLKVKKFDGCDDNTVAILNGAKTNFQKFDTAIPLIDCDTYNMTYSLFRNQTRRTDFDKLTKK